MVEYSEISHPDTVKRYGNKVNLSTSHKPLKLEKPNQGSYIFEFYQSVKNPEILIIHFRLFVQEGAGRLSYSP